MKKILFVLVALALIAVPAFADTTANVSSNTTVNGSVHISQGSVKWREFKESMNDVFYRVRYSFTFNEESKVDLISERKIDLKQRQEAWVDLKNAVLSGNLSAEERIQILATLKKEHESIVAERLVLNAELQKIHVHAKEKKNKHLEQKIEKAENETDDKDNLVHGIKALLKQNPNYNNTSVMSESEARLRVSSLGFNVTSAELQNKENLTVWIVRGERTFISGNETIKNVEVFVIDARTDLILDIDSFNYVNGDLYTKSHENSNEESDISVKAEKKKSGETSLSAHIGVGV